VSAIHQTNEKHNVLTAQGTTSNFATFQRKHPESAYPGLPVHIRMHPDVDV